MKLIQILKSRKSFSAKPIALLAIRIASMLASSLTSVYLARHMGAAEYGQLAIIMSAIAISLMPMQVGISRMIVRDLGSIKCSSSLKKEKHRYEGATKATVLSVGLAMIAFFGFLWLYHSRMSVIPSYLITSAILLLVSAHFFYLFQSIEVSTGRLLIAYLCDGVIRQTPIIIICMLAAFLYPAANRKISSVEILAATALGYVFSIPFLSSRTKTKNIISGINFRNVKFWARRSAPFTLMTFSDALLQNLDIVMIGLLLASHQAGTYKVGVLLGSLPGISIAVGALIVYPMLAEQNRALRKETSVEARELLIQVGLFSLAVIFTLVFYGREIINIIFGREYMDAYGVTLILSVSQLFNLIGIQAKPILIIRGEEYFVLSASLIALLCCALGNVAIIPKYGLLGVSILMAILNFSLNVTYFYKASKI